MKDVYAVVEKRSRLLRTRILAAVEFLDQLYQYGRAGIIIFDGLGRVGYDEDVKPLDVLIDE